ncbi:MAG: response regulator transcription factor [Candidatus Omnitrophica bacterium]|nr:response regulator transcription factor [bacterium]MBV6480382.1 Regulator of RpoS [bacterium]MCC6732373.1 response regulator transcription factor [Candidatus Omnitrophota bacterium]MCE7909789.1 DNA-binding response regulator [Candidatus Omnitrophica bacterium COP1]
MPQKILVVDDDKEITRLIEYDLQEEGFSVQTAMTARATLQMVSESRFDMVILDLKLPDQDGREVLRELKQNPDTSFIPILVLSARAGEADRVVCFELGCDDYVVKPFNHRELALRTKAILRRLNPPLDTAGVMTFADLVLDTTRRQIILSGKVLSLTPIEYRLLVFLARRKRVVQSRDILIREVWRQNPNDVENRLVDTHIRRLRKKLGHMDFIIRTRHKKKEERRLRLEGGGQNIKDDDDAICGYFFDPPEEGLVGYSREPVEADEDYENSTDEDSPITEAQYRQ